MRGTSCSIHTYDTRMFVLGGCASSPDLTNAYLHPFVHLSVVHQPDLMFIVYLLPSISLSIHPWEQELAGLRARHVMFLNSPAPPSYQEPPPSYSSHRDRHVQLRHDHEVHLCMHATHNFRCNMYVSWPCTFYIHIPIRYRDTTAIAIETYS